MPTLYVSTKNRDKLRELAELLGDGVTIHHPDEKDRDVEETGATLWENAVLKAEAGHRRSGLITIADDTGLEVDALGGEPGVYSARYAGKDASYQDNLQKLIDEMDGKSPRTARFRTVIACVGATDDPLRFDGVLDGEIGTQPRGDNGFGYDPVFYPEGDERSLAEYSSEEKNAISHRGRALRAFIAWWTEQNTET